LPAASSRFRRSGNEVWPRRWPPADDLREAGAVAKDDERDGAGDQVEDVVDSLPQASLDRPVASDHCPVVFDMTL
jgi:hypothetical protein